MGGGGAGGGRAPPGQFSEGEEWWVAGEENPELVVMPELLLHPAGEPALQTVNTNQVGIIIKI